MKRPFSYEPIPDRSAPEGCHFRVRDADDNRIATCYGEESAKGIVALLNAPAWMPVTSDQPAPLEDVLVSVYHPGEEPMVYAAYRRQTDPTRWVISGSDCEQVTGVYAWAPCPGAAACPSVQQVAA